MVDVHNACRALFYGSERRHVRLSISVVDELADVRHTLAFIRHSISELSDCGMLQADVLSGYDLIMAKIETQLREVEKKLESFISQKEDER